MQLLFTELQRGDAYSARPQADCAAACLLGSHLLSFQFSSELAEVRESCWSNLSVPRQHFDWLLCPAHSGQHVSSLNHACHAHPALHMAVSALESNANLRCQIQVLDQDPGNIYAANGVAAVLGEQGHFMEAQELLTNVSTGLAVGT